jgi:hypothetical protein
MKKKSSGIKKNKTDLVFEKKVMERILDGGTLNDIESLIKTYYKDKWKPILLKKVGLISVF